MTDSNRSSQIVVSISAKAWSYVRWNSSVLWERDELVEVWNSAERKKRGRGFSFTVTFPSIESATHIAEYLDSVYGLKGCDGDFDQNELTACGVAARRIWKEIQG